MTRKFVMLRSATASAVLALTLASAPFLVAQAQDAGSFAGYWSGEVGSERERVAIGVDLQEDGKGGLDVRLDLPVVHFDRMHVGAAHIEGGALVHPTLPMALRLEDGHLVGTLLGEDEHARLQRGAPAPVAAPVEQVPALPGPRWSTRLGGLVFASPVVSEGIAYVGTTGGTLNAVDTSDGRIVWAVGLGFPMYGAALVEGDAVYVVSDGGYLHRLDGKDGREVWRHALDDGRRPRVLPHPTVFDWDWEAPRPVLADGVVYAGGADGVLHAVDAVTGAPRWSFAGEGRIRHAVAVDPGSVYVAFESGDVHALDRASGQERWRYALGGQAAADLLVHDGKVYASGRNAYLHAIDAASGQRAWRQNFWTSWIDSAPVISDGTLYIGSSDMRRVSAIDPASGRVLWRTDVLGQTWGTPLVLGERVVVGAAAAAPYFLRHEAGLAVLDRRSGALLARLALPEGHGHQWGIAGNVSRSGDTLVAADIEGRLMGFDLPE
ncbi:outer membrane protein assembly factor BamB [Pseudoxanthomonas broegbernensis]|nr:PQQ-binding-like beta-propeller repeat protein [Pseudoxanthomonas broegbernensis]MBB6065235.1 outer membrane protein assembly factor BamB [Pseudoxanthomonas broegbernensis]